jgi:S-adenosylmethionine:tRNA ribosyltransferase-isomerase
MKTLESSTYPSGLVKPDHKWANKFIFPPYDFNVATSMITNFHPSQSSMMMMSAGFAGFDFLMEAYSVAIKEKYRFLTYGDAMLIL